MQCVATSAIIRFGVPLSTDDSDNYSLGFLRRYRTASRKIADDSQVIRVHEIVAAHSNRRQSLHVDEFLNPTPGLLQSPSRLCRVYQVSAHYDIVPLGE
jgi:hypothetical protein